MGALDTLIKISFSTLIAKKFTDWDAFKLGLIDKSGNKLRNPSTKEEKNSLSTITNLVRKVKRTLLKFSPDTPTVNFLLANALLKEAIIELNENTNIIETYYLDLYFKEEHNINIDDFLIEKLNSKMIKGMVPTIYTDIFNNAKSAKDPDGSYQCHQSIKWAKEKFKTDWWYKELKFIEWNESKWKEISKKLISDNAIKKFSQKPIKYLIEDISDFSVNGHSLMKLGDIYIDPYLKTMKVSNAAIQKFGRYWETL
jgi:hypothetical protein